MQARRRRPLPDSRKQPARVYGHGVAQLYPHPHSGSPPPWRGRLGHGRVAPTTQSQREEIMRATMRLLALGASAGALLLPAEGARAQLLITGNDEKVSFDETAGGPSQSWGSGGHRHWRV